MQVFKKAGIGVLTRIALAATLVVASFATPVARAGGGSTGGGVVFVCRNFFRTHVFLADSYPLRDTPIFQRIKRLKLSNPSEAMDGAIQIFREQNASVADLLVRSLKEIHETEQGPLPLLGNDQIQDVPKNCSKRQLAIQNFETGELEVDPELRDRLSSTDKLLFKLHESYLRALWRLKTDASPDIQRVREQVLSWAENPSFVEFMQTSGKSFSAERPAPPAKCGLEGEGNSNECLMSIWFRYLKAIHGCARGASNFADPNLARFASQPAYELGRAIQDSAIEHRAFHFDAFAFCIEKNPGFDISLDDLRRSARWVDLLNHFSPWDTLFAADLQALVGDTGTLVHFISERTSDVLRDPGTLDRVASVLFDPKRGIFPGTDMDLIALEATLRADAAPGSMATVLETGRKLMPQTGWAN